MTDDMKARGVPPTWAALRDAIEKMVAFPAGTGWHVSRDAADKALSWIGWAEVHQSSPVPKLLSEEDEDLSLVWRTADGWAIYRTFPSDEEPYWLATPSRNPAALSDHPAVKALVEKERESASVLRSHAAAAAVLLRIFEISGSVAQFLEDAIAKFDEAAALSAKEGE